MPVEPSLIGTDGAREKRQAEQCGYAFGDYPRGNAPGPGDSTVGPQFVTH